MKCPHCGQEIDDLTVAHHMASRGGKSTSEAKRAATRRNIEVAREAQKRQREETK
jgi:hypothetical protein